MDDLLVLTQDSFCNEHGSQVHLRCDIEFLRGHCEGLVRGYHEAVRKLTAVRAEVSLIIHSSRLPRLGTCRPCTLDEPKELRGTVSVVVLMG